VAEEGVYWREKTTRGTGKPFGGSERESAGSQIEISRKTWARKHLAHEGGLAAKCKKELLTAYQFSKILAKFARRGRNPVAQEVAISTSERQGATGTSVWRRL